MARPTLPDDERRSQSVAGLRVTAAEREQILERAQLAGLKPSTYLRRTALGRRTRPPVVVPAINHETARDLSRLGGLLNQAITALHRQQSKTVPEALLEEIHRTLLAARAELKGQAPAT